MPKILIIPADNRQLYMTKYLTDKGFDCTAFNPNLPPSDSERAFDGVIFALPSEKNNAINCEFDVNLENILPLIKKGGYAFTAMAEDEFCRSLELSGLKTIDYYARDELKILNAYATAQGVLLLILINSDVLVKNLKVLVTGYGKTGEATACLLNKNMADVTVAVRKSRDIARIESAGMTGISYDELPDIAEKFDFVVNTVPAIIFNKKLLSMFSEKCKFLEVASKPYGIDMESAEKSGREIIIASSLPGKYVRESAGTFIAQTIINIVKEENLWMQ